MLYHITISSLINPLLIDEYYRAFPINEEQNKVLSETKLQMPVLALGGDIYPAFGGDAPGNFALDSTQGLAENVKGVIIPLSGHYIAEERPDFLIKELPVVC